MRNRLLRPLLIVEFLIAIEAIFTFWSEVGGQYHLDLMFWPWKFGVSLAAASLIVAITANLARNDGAITRLTLTLSSFLIAIIVVAGMVTYYYHLNEPPDPDDQDEDEPARVSLMERELTRPGRHSLREPSAALPYNRTPSETPAYWKQFR
jgi:hypothetical protein